MVHQSAVGVASDTIGHLLYSVITMHTSLITLVRMLSQEQITAISTTVELLDVSQVSNQTSNSSTALILLTPRPSPTYQSYYDYPSVALPLVKELKNFSLYVKVKHMKKHIVYIEDNKKSRPRPHERKTADILATLFQSDIVFMRRIQSKAPDLYILKTNTCWELKSPIGN